MLMMKAEAAASHLAMMTTLGMVRLLKQEEAVQLDPPFQLMMVLQLWLAGHRTAVGLCC